MIFLCTPTYFEGKSLINKLNLKKDITVTKFQVFNKQDIVLLITGVGKVKSAIAVTYLLANYKITSSDFLINIGICGCTNKNLKLGESYLCNKLIDNDSNKTFFPDIIFNHPFCETSIQTFSHPVTNSSDLELKCTLVDMESTAIYESAATFLQPHQIFIIRIISDYLSPDKINKQQLSEYIDKCINKTLKLISDLKCKFKYDKCFFTEKDKQLLNRISENLKFSTSMKFKFKQLLTYYYFVNGDISNIVNKLINIKCKSKKEGKIYLAEIRHEFI